MKEGAVLQSNASGFEEPHFCDEKNGILSPDQGGPPRRYPVSPVAYFVAALLLVSSYHDVSSYHAFQEKLQLNIGLVMLHAVCRCHKLS